MKEREVWRPTKIISGAQTGVDRAALDVAIELGMEHSGWVPRGRRAEDGPIPYRYQVCETPSADYALRTEWNVRDADATLIISRGQLSGGSGLTMMLARYMGKPVLHIDLERVSAGQAVRQLADWLNQVRPKVLNVAGQRESTTPGIYEAAASLLRAALTDQDTSTDCEGETE